MRSLCALLCVLAHCASPAVGAVNALDRGMKASKALMSLDRLELLDGTAEIATYRGRRAVHLLPSPDHETPEDSIVAILVRPDFHNGVIEAKVAGAPRSGAPPDSRGFVGIAFRAQTHGSKYEIFYLRPTNGRSDDQLRRNHSVQYASEPDFPWNRLRRENPGVYESYVDLDPGRWTTMKIVVSGTKAQLYVNGSLQPCLVVDGLKLGDTSGLIALWAHWTTDAYFSEVKVNSRRVF